MIDLPPMQRTMGWLRQPEYIGENRCVPCTAVNLVISAILSVVIGLVSVPMGIGAFVVFAGLIYVRGYLIPYTPTLTKRYFPERVLRAFDKQHNRGFESDEAGLVDIQETLDSMDLIESCENDTDICLNDDFRSEWQAVMDHYGDKTEQIPAVATLLGIDADQLSKSVFGEAVVVHYENQKVGQWESDGALIADVAADEVLRESSRNWASLDPVNRGRVLNSLRLFLEQCPVCHGMTSLGQETVESCCRSVDVAAVSCEECGARLFELEMDGLDPL